MLDEQNLNYLRPLKRSHLLLQCPLHRFHLLLRCHLPAPHLCHLLHQFQVTKVLQAKNLCRLHKFKRCSHQICPINSLPLLLLLQLRRLRNYLWVLHHRRQAMGKSIYLGHLKEQVRRLLRRPQASLITSNLLGLHFERSQRWSTH